MERKSSAYLYSDDMFSTYAQKTYVENISFELAYDCPIIKISKETVVKRNVVLKLGGTGIGNSEVLGYLVTFLSRNIKMLKFYALHLNTPCTNVIFKAFEERKV